MLKILFVVLLVGSTFIVDPFVFYSYQTPKNYFLILFIQIILIYTMYSALRKKEDGLQLNLIIAILVIRIVWIGFSSAFSLHSLENLNIEYITCLSLLTLIISNLSEIKKHTLFESLVSSFILISVGSALIGFIQLYGNINFDRQLIKTPMVGLIGSPNGFGILMAVGILSCSIKFKMANTIKIKLIMFVLGLILIVALLLNGSRGAQLALAITGLFLFFYSGFFSKKQTLLFFIRSQKYLLFALILVVGLFSIYLYNKNESSSEGRLFIWEVSSKMVIDNPLNGVGYGNYQRDYLYYQASFFQDTLNSHFYIKATNLKQAHNEYLQAFCETGIIGGLLFLLVWGVAFLGIHTELKDGFNEAKWKLFVLGFLLLLGSHALLDTTFHVFPLLILPYLLMGFVSIRYIKVPLNRYSQIFILMVVVGLIIYQIKKDYNEYKGYKKWYSGYEHAGNGKWLWAKTDYEDAIKIIPEQGELLFHYGASLVFLGEYSKSLYYLNKSLTYFTDRNIFLTRSLANLKLNNYQKAEEDAKISLSMFPDQLAPHLLLGEIYFHMGNITESKKSLTKCINEDTRIKSEETLQIQHDAKLLWSQLYQE
ncbi:MAG: O-antigen ligase family protein [Bacteroidetes bacterium]|nr:O-antigen ligase family protein [Bacteroidota bacterium]